MNQAMEKTRDEFQKAKAAVTNDFKAIVNDAEALLHATAQISGEGFSAERAKFADKLRHAKVRLAEAEQHVYKKTKQAVTVTDDYVHANPWTAIGIGAAVGTLIGILISRR